MRARVRLQSIAAALPPHRRTSAEVESLIAQHSSGRRIPPGAVEAMTGIRERRVVEDEVQCSDLAAEAGRKALTRAAVDPDEVDVLIYASAGQDLLEPATANIVQDLLGTKCQVFDVKNACNSFLNGVQLAEALIASGSCKTALVASGEVCSRAIAWHAADARMLKRNFIGYTMGDAGAAAVIGRADNGRGIVYRRFESLSGHWNLATIPCGGSRHPRGEEFTYVRGDGSRLRDVFLELGPPLFAEMMREAGVAFDECRRIFVHQVSVSYLEDMCRVTGIPLERVEVTVAELGNMASASIPVAHALAEERGAVGPGDRVLWVGLASGISLGVMVIDL